MDDRNQGFAPLDERQHAAAVALAEGQKVAAVALKIGVTERTVRRWREMPAFAAVLAEAQGDIIDAARVRLAGLLDDALDAVAAVLRDATAPPASRIRAAEVVLARAGLDAPKTETTVDPTDAARALEFLRWESERKGAAGGNG